MLIHQRLCFIMQDLGKIYCRIHKLMSLLDAVILYFMHTSFYYIICLQHINMDHDLLMTLIERWRWETHTFHLYVGEMTPTLQDVVVLFGLPIDGWVGIAVGIQDKIALCKHVFGRVPLPKMFKRNALSMSWLLKKKKFKLPDNCDDKILLWYVNAY